MDDGNGERDAERRHRFAARPHLACALACGVMVANIYYAQSLVGLTGPEPHFSASGAGSIVTVTPLPRWA